MENDEEVITHVNTNTRIFRPYEFQKFIDIIPRTINKERVEFLLYTGVRYTEGVEVWGKTERFHKTTNKLKIKNTKAKVVKKQKYRYVNLNPKGVLAVERYFNHPQPLLEQSAGFWMNMNRWFKQSGLKAGGEIGSKTLRKTYESWLVNSYPEKTVEIVASMGHSETTAIKHYLSFPFTLQDKQRMLEYVEGW